MTDQARVPRTIQCPACDWPTSHQNDIREGYCRNCHWWTGDPELAWTRPGLFTANNRTPPQPPGTTRTIRGLRAHLYLVDDHTDDHPDPTTTATTTASTTAPPTGAAIYTPTRHHAQRPK